MKPSVTSKYEESATRNWQNDKDSVGDDLESFQERMMTSPLLTKYRPDEIQKTFLFQKLTKTNFDQIGPFVRSNRLLHGSRKTRRKLRYPKTESNFDHSEDRFIQNDCSRRTFFI